MSTDLEQALRAAFRDAAETVVPSPEPMRRLLQRRRRRWAGLTSFFAAVAVTLSAALVPALQLGSPDRNGGDEGYQITSPWTRTLLDSPTRGSLSGDSPLQIEVERQIRERGGDNPRLDRVKLLFLGDAAGRRFIAYARFNATHAALYYNDGDPGAAAAQLVGGGFANLRLDPLVRIGSRTGPSMVGLVPADCRFATSSTATIEENGTATRDWAEAPTGSWLARESLQPAERWRVDCNGVPMSEGPAVPTDEVAAGDDLFALGGLAHGAVVQRWSGPIEGTAGTWTLTTTLLSGGGVAAVLASGTSGKFTVATDFAPPSAPAGDGPTDDRGGLGLMSTAISANPDVIAIRVPERQGAHAYYGEKILVVTTAPGAWSVLVPASPGFFGTYLDNGVSVLRTDGGVITVRDVAEADVGRTYVATERDGPQYLGETIVQAW